MEPPHHCRYGSCSMYAGEAYAQDRRRRSRSQATLKVASDALSVAGREPYASQMYEDRAHDLRLLISHGRPDASDVVFGEADHPGPPVREFLPSSQPTMVFKCGGGISNARCIVAELDAVVDGVQTTRWKAMRQTTRWKATRQTTRSRKITRYQYRIND